MEFILQKKTSTGTGRGKEPKEFLVVAGAIPFLNRYINLLLTLLLSLWPNGFKDSFKDSIIDCELTASSFPCDCCG
jgi:hypothetical protein